jgi:cell shape-determining protein MreC
MEKTEENIPKLIKIMQEILMLFSDILTLPIRVLISESHYGIKTAINSVVSEEEGLFGSIKDRIDTIFDQIQEIRT